MDRAVLVLALILLPRALPSFTSCFPLFLGTTSSFVTVLAPTKKPHKVTFDLVTFYDMYVIDPNSNFSPGHWHSTVSDDVQLPSTEYCTCISNTPFGGISVSVLTKVFISVYCLTSGITETISPPGLRNVGPSPRPYGIFYEPQLHGPILPPEPFQFFECQRTICKIYALYH